MKKAIIAFCLSVVGLVLISGLRYCNRMEVEVLGTKFDQEEFILPDSTKITLLPNSKMEYKRKYSDHNIVRIQGSAYIHNTKPIEIIKGNIRIKSTHAQFSIKEQESCTYVEVTAGEIIVLTKQGEKQLNPSNNLIILNKEGIEASGL